MSHTPELLDRLASYALGLPDADVDGTLAAHLATGCDDCVSQLRELRETVALLALGAEPLNSSSDLSGRILDRVRGESFSFVFSGAGNWQEDAGLEIKRLYGPPEGGSTSLISLRAGSSLAEAYRAGHLGYVILRGELDGEGLRLGPGDFVPAAGRVPGRKFSVIGDTVLVAVAGSKAAAPLETPRAVRWAKAAWNLMEPGTLALPLAGSAAEGVEISLIRMEPGASVARHRHDWVEEVCLISGDCRCQGVELGPEDYHRASPGSTHDVTTTVAGCTMVYITRQERAA
jgi:quercetin dioxygenase-like cupin family protein